MGWNCFLFVVRCVVRFVLLFGVCCSLVVDWCVVCLALCCCLLGALCCVMFFGLLLGCCLLLECCCFVVCCFVGVRCVLRVAYCVLFERC